jgi:hypothetical protein
MTLAEIKQMRGESLYDRDGNLVGKWYGERGMLADCFIVRERTCHVVNEVDIFGDRTEVHDCCGDMHIRDMFTGRTYPYCPGCGARVVDE